MKLRIVYAVRAAGKDGDALWLEDTCAGGSWSLDERAAVTWRTIREVREALEAAELAECNGAPLEVVHVVEERRALKRD